MQKLTIAILVYCILLIYSPVSYGQSITGLITDENQSNAINACVNLSGDAISANTTNSNGNFSFTNLNINGTYKVEPYNDEDHSNSVSTIDLVIITQHILGVQALNSPYKMIAADADKSNSITTFDIVQLRKLILFLNSDIPNNTSYRFVDASYTFPNPSNPFIESFPESITIDSLGMTEIADFIVVKVGDVNDSNVPNLTGSCMSTNTVTFTASSTIASPGDSVMVDVLVDNFTDILAMQYSMNFDTTVLEFVGFTNFNLPGLSSNSFGTFWSPNGVLTHVWSDPNLDGESLPNGSSVYSIIFNVKNTSAGLTGNLSFSGTLTVIEIIDASSNNLPFASNSGAVSVPPATTPTVSMKAPYLSASNGSSVCFDVTVEDFEDIVSMQYSIDFDPNILSYSNVQTFGLPGLSSVNFGTNLANNGSLTFSWSDPLVAGITLPNDSIIYEVCFDVIGNSGILSPLDFTSSVIPIEITDNNGVVLNLVTPMMNPPVATATGSVINCINPNSTLDGTGSSVGVNFSYTWTKVSGNGNLVGATNGITATANGTGVFKLTVTNTANGDMASTDVTVIEDVTNPTVIASASTITCANPNSTLDGTGSSMGVNFIYMWTKVSGNGNLVGATNGITATTNGTGVFKLTVTNTANGCTESIDVSVNQVLPTAICVDSLTVALSSSGTATILAQNFDNGSTDNCGNQLIFTCSKDGINFAPSVQFDCSEILTPVAVTLRVTNASSSYSDCSTQVVVKDVLAPTLVCPSDITISTDLGTCYGTANLVSPIASDNCSVNLNVSGSSIGATNINPLFGITLFNVGISTVLHMAIDDYGNSSSCSYDVFVMDNQPPTAICEDSISVSLSSSGIAIIDAEDFDNGSVDNCGNQLVFTASKSGVNFSPTLQFDCTELDTTLNVILRVSDSLDPSSYSDCSTPVSVMDLLAPVLVCPPDITLDCQDEVPVDFSSFGFPTITDNCGSVTTEVDITNTTQNDVVTTNREFTVTDSSGNSSICSQTLVTKLNPNLSVEGEYQVCEGDDFDLNSIIIIDENETNPTITFHSSTPATANNEVSNTTVYPVSNTTYYILGTTASGCTNETSITINIFNDPAPVCNDVVQASLDQHCQIIITPDMILEGTYYYDFYEVEISDGAGNSIGSKLDGSHIGKMLTVKVTDLCYGNKCWGKITVEDKLPPKVHCEPAREIDCMDNPEEVSPPKAWDNCEGQVVAHLSQSVILDDDICDDSMIVIKRTWVAFDQYENESAPCMDTIIIKRSGEVDFPDDVAWDCETYCNYPNVIEPTPKKGGNAETGSGTIVTGNHNYCAYSVTHSDQILPTCGNPDKSFKIIRTWTVLDWCTGETIITGKDGEDNKQIIKVEDTKGPDISIGNLEASANKSAAHPQICRSTDFIPPANIMDNCNDWTVKIYTPVGELLYGNGQDGKEGGYIPEPGLPLGNHTITYQAEDACGNVTIKDVTLKVVDDINPTVICDEYVEIVLSNIGVSDLYASSLDDGSADNCCLDKLLVSRLGIPGSFKHKIQIDCNDVENNPLSVFLQAVDCAGNTNQCEINLTVTFDQLPSNISCPSDVTIDCNKYVEDLETALNFDDFDVLHPFGSATFDNHCGIDLDETSVVIDIDNCKAGTITRTWQVSNQAGGTVSCTQEITVEHISDFEVLFPENIDVNCGDSLPDFGEPELFFEDCELLATSYEEQLFNIVPDACYKIVRNWTVINWCTVGDLITNSLPDPLVDTRRYKDGGDGYIEYQQVIKVSDNSNPVFTSACEDINIDILNNDCSATVIIPPVLVQDCGSDLNVDVISDLGTGFGPFIDVKPGIYNVTYQASDNCGNTSLCHSTITIVDGVKPTPYCKNGLIVEITNTTPPSIELWASDLDAGSFDNCGDVTLSFDSDGTQNMLFDCDNIGQNPVEIWVTDESGNQDFCVTNLIIQDNMNACSGNPLIVKGNLSTEENLNIANVEVELNGGFNDFVLTEPNGNYEFEVPANSDISITPVKDEDILNGVTTYDLVLISKHILGTKKLDSPYKMIAADANKSGTITTFDLVSIRKAILFITDEFPNNASWRFIDKAFEFPNESNPWESSFPEIINLNNVSSDINHADFIAVKIGDVNASVSGNIVDLDDRHYKSNMTLMIENKKPNAREEFRVDFRVEDLNHFGYQFSIGFDNESMEFKNIISGVMNKENFGLKHLDKGVITASWHSQSPVQLDRDAIIFSMIFEAKKDMDLSEKLFLHPDFTSSEAYHANGNFEGIDLLFQKTVTEKSQLYQNTPNPFSDVTTIGFDIQQKQSCTFRLLDNSGKVIKEFTSVFDKGYNELKLKNTDFNEHGLYYYQLITDSRIKTRKMVFMP